MFALSPGLQRVIAALGCAEPFPVQAAVIPRALAGADLCVSASTGSGKTLAFAVPLIERLGHGPARGHGGGGASIKALVLVPTRELAAQVGGVFKALEEGAARTLAVLVVHGGGSINPDMLALRGGADILVATPGRLLDLASRNAVRLGSVECLVLDEADRMLGLGFREELEAILALLPARRQTLLFSATIEGEIESIAKEYTHDGERIEIVGGPPPATRDPSAAAAGRETGRPPGGEAGRSLGRVAGIADAGSVLLEIAEIVEIVHPVAAEAKGPFLRSLLEGPPRLERVLVFASSTRRVDNVTRKLVNNGIAATAFHGGLSQAARTAALEAFRKGRVRVLVASDLASRGLDIEGLPCVINYELPRQPLDYVHRIGRTGRAGMPGLAITLMGPGEDELLRLIERRLGRRIPRSVG